MNSIALNPNKLIVAVLAVASIGVAAFGPDDAQARSSAEAPAGLSIEASAPGLSGELASTVRPSVA